MTHVSYISATMQTQKCGWNSKGCSKTCLLSYSPRLSRTLATHTHSENLANLFPFLGRVSLLSLRVTLIFCSNDLRNRSAAAAVRNARTRGVQLRPFCLSAYPETRRYTGEGVNG